MEEEKRKGEIPIPEKLEEILNEVQLLELQKMEGFGWELRFVRRPLIQETVIVMIHPDRGKIGILEADGTPNMQSDVKIRQ